MIKRVVLACVVSSTPILAVLPDIRGEVATPPPPAFVPPDAAPRAGAASTLNAFNLPALFQSVLPLQMRFAEYYRAQNWAAAANIAARAVEILHGDAGWRLLHARVLTRRGLHDKALDELDRAVKGGLRATQALEQDADLAPLRGLPRFAAILEASRAPADGGPLAPFLGTNPARIGIADGTAHVTVSNTVWDARTALFHVGFDAPAPAESPAARSAAYRGPAAEFLRPLLAAGKAAGNLGDLYDNRDRGHARLNTPDFPGLARVVYASEALTQHVDMALAGLRFSLPTVGNASLAQTDGPAWRSLPRTALTEPDGAARMALLYLTGHLYVYPEHHDHDPRLGDLFPANTPYVVISQGSSGSDRPFLKALFATLAALPPEIKRQLVASGQLMPTLQRLLRATQRGLEAPEAYFTGAAHPVVFDAARLDAEAMVRAAQSLAIADVLPQPFLRVVDEPAAVPGVDYFDTVSEILFDTPGAIARVFRRLARTRVMTVAAGVGAGTPPAGAAWRWVVLQGDPRATRVVPETPDGSRARIEVDWQARVVSGADATLTSARVDIGCFLTLPDGRASAPSFVSIAFLRDEQRRYAEDPPHRLLRVDYTGAPAYVDPLLTARRDWRDEYDYDAAGRLRGWTRWRGTEAQRFTPDGFVVEQAGEDGTPLRVRAVSYRREAAATPGDMPRLVQETGRPR